MITFTKPENLNGTELRDELNAGGVTISYDPASVCIDEDGALVLDIDSKDQSKAESIVATHNGTTVAPDKTTEKSALLAKLGITEDEAKLLLS
jgi:hypothetical protein